MIYNEGQGHTDPNSQNSLTRKGAKPVLKNLFFSIESKSQFRIASNAFVFHLEKNWKGTQRAHILQQNSALTLTLTIKVRDEGQGLMKLLSEK